MWNIQTKRLLIYFTCKTPVVILIKNTTLPDCTNSGGWCVFVEGRGKWGQTAILFHVTAMQVKHITCYEAAHLLQSSFHDRHDFWTDPYDHQHPGQANNNLCNITTWSSRGGLEVEQWSDNRTLSISVDQSPLGACMIIWY